MLTLWGIQMQIPLNVTSGNIICKESSCRPFHFFSNLQHSIRILPATILAYKVANICNSVSPVGGGSSASEFWKLWQRNVRRLSYFPIITYLSALKYGGMLIGQLKTVKLPCPLGKRAVFVKKHPVLQLNGTLYILYIYETKEKQLKKYLHLILRTLFVIFRYIDSKYLDVFITNLPLPLQLT